MATPTHGSTEKPGGPPPFPPFQKEFFASQLLWLGLSFVILYVLMAKVALPRVAGILENRRARIAADLAEAQKAREQSEAAAAAHEKALADARNGAQAIANETRDKFAAEAEAKRKTLEAELHGKLLEAEKTIAATKTSAMANVHSIAVESASAIVERLVGAVPAGPAVDAAVDRALKG